MAPQVVPSGSEYAFDSAIATLEAHDREVDTLDAKVGILLAADGVVAGFIFGSNPAGAAGWPAVCEGVLLVLSASLALASFWPRRFARVPDAPTLVHLAARHPRATTAELKWQFIRNALDGIEKNRLSLYSKVRLIKGAALTLLGTIITLAVAAMLK